MSLCTMVDELDTMMRNGMEAQVAHKLISNKLRDTILERMVKDIENEINLTHNK